MTGGREHPDIDKLRVIEARDPHGVDSIKEPAPGEWERFRDWAIETYGPDVWFTYHETAWGDWGTDPV